MGTLVGLPLVFCIIFFLSYKMNQHSWCALSCGVKFLSFDVRQGSFINPEKRYRRGGGMGEFEKELSIALALQNFSDSEKNP